MGKKEKKKSAADQQTFPPQNQKSPFPFDSNSNRFVFSIGIKLCLQISQTLISFSLFSNSNSSFFLLFFAF